MTHSASPSTMEEDADYEALNHDEVAKDAIEVPSEDEVPSDEEVAAAAA